MSLDGQLEVTADRRAVTFVFTVENAGVEPIELTLTSGLTADFAVFDDGDERWRWSDGRVFTEALRTARLAPGESFAETATWTDPVTGEYVARATLEAQNATVETTAEFSV